MRQLFSGLLILIYILITATVGIAQSVNFEDGFEDGDFTGDPAWSGDTGQYTVINGTPNFLLQLQGDDENGGVSYLSTPSSETEGSWEFFINLDFSPSGSNYADIFLMSDIADLEGAVNGYAVRAGESGGDDVFRIVRYDGGSEAATVLSGTTDISAGGEFRVKVTRQNGGVWSLEVGEGYGGQLSQEGGTATDNTYSSTSFFGVRSTYTSSRYDFFTYDFKIDLPPFIVTAATANANQVDVAFNRPYDQSSVQPVDFSLDNEIGSPTSVSFPSATTVRLTYGSDLPSNEYTLSVQDIEDQNGNSLESGATADFIVFADFTDGDVIINEFMYDPPGGQAEYVELKNLSDKYLNLQNWLIADNSGTGAISTDTLVLRPNSFLAVSEDTSALFNTYGSRLYAQSADLPALNNSGDVVKLITNGNALADSLQYATEWGGENVALERRSDTAPSIYRENFGDSPNSLGGTPGLANEVADDTTPPGLDNLTVTDTQTLDLDFSERLELSASENTGNYSLNNGINIDNAQQTAGDSVRLSLSSPLQNGTEYQLTISNQQDIFGNTTASIDSSFTYYEVTPADSGEIFINEFRYDPPEGASEYIELHNPTSESFDLQGWTINDNTGSRQTITNNRFIVPPDSFIVIAPDISLLNQNPDIALVNMGNTFPSLNNSGDDIVLRDSTGQRLDSLQYTPAWGGGGVALERRTTDVAPFQANFGDSPNGIGTPGRQNEIPEDTTPPDLADFTIINAQSLQFVFNEQVDLQSATDTGNYTINGGISINSATLAGGDTVQIALSQSLRNDTEYTATIDGVSDRFGNSLTDRDTTFTYFEVSPAGPGDIFLNEFSYDPPEGSTEYIELYNLSSKSLDLQDWTINDNTGTRRTITDSQFIVPPDSYVVLAPDNTLKDSLPDINLVAMGSRFPSLNNSGDDIVLRDAENERLDSLRYTTAWGGDNVALERRTTNAPPVAANFGDAPNGFGTPGDPNRIEADETPPDLTGFSIPADQTLILTFSEGLANNNATDSGNYSIDNSISVNNASQFAPDSVRLELSSPLQNDTEYQLSITNQQDIFGNTANEIDTTFTYYEISQADSGDILINEFTYDPPTGSTEYIELYNASSKTFNLNGWTINDNTGNQQTITGNRSVVPPDSYVVIAPDETLLNDFPDINLIPMGSRFPSLNNSGDDIVVRDADGVRLDSLQYTSSWGGSEIALERRTVSIPPLQPNFGDAPNEFGTPGAVNEIPNDDQPPVLENLQIVDNTTVQLTFTETISGETATDQSNYSFSPNRNIQLISSVNDTVALFLSQELQSEQTYELIIRNLQDIFGNTIENITRELTFVQFSDARPGDIVINEILYTREHAGDPEFVELYNRTDQNFDLSGWKLGDASGAATIDDGTRLRSGSFLVITDDATLADAVENGVFLSNFPSLNDDEDAVYIRDPGGATIDSLFYNLAFGNPTDGTSIERKDPSGASNDPANFAASNADNRSTAGQENSVFKPDETPPGITFARIFPNGDIEVRFSEFITLSDEVRFSINGQPLSIDEFDPTAGNRIFLNTPAGIEPDSPQTLVAENLTDVRGNGTASAEIPVAQLLTPGSVVINEILYNPISESDDNRPDQSEYVELRNTRDYAVSLEGIILHDAPDEDGEIRALNPVNTGSKYIPANGTALIYADEARNFDESQIADFFNLTKPADHTLIRVDRSSLSLASTDDAIYLTGDEGIKIDSVFYDESWQNPNLADTDGIALERINPVGPSNDISNWGSSTAESGGTPNQENTLFQEPSEAPEDEIGISFNPNPFSPDGDGADDRLFINYKLDQPDYLISVRIYDRYGRLVRELADGKPAGLEGSLIWDGLKDNGNRNRIGIYIVVFKAFDSTNGGEEAFKKTVVLARRLN